MPLAILLLYPELKKEVWLCTYFARVHCEDKLWINDIHMKQIALQCYCIACAFIIWIIFFRFICLGFSQLSKWTVLMKLPLKTMVQYLINFKRQVYFTFKNTFFIFFSFFFIFLILNYFFELKFLLKLRRWLKLNLQNN